MQEVVLLYCKTESVEVELVDGRLTSLTFMQQMQMFVYSHRLQLTLTV